MIYADYAFYKDSYFGTSIQEADFPRLALRASAFLDYYTMGRAEKNADLEALKMACCAIAEAQQTVDAAQASTLKAASGDGIKSESVGSFTRTYQTASETAAASESAKASFAALARQYLAHTGLLYRGGGCCQ